MCITYNRYVHKHKPLLFRSLSTKLGLLHCGKAQTTINILHLFFLFEHCIAFEFTVWLTRYSTLYTCKLQWSLMDVHNCQYQPWHGRHRQAMCQWINRQMCTSHQLHSNGLAHRVCTLFMVHHVPYTVKSVVNVTTKCTLHFHYLLVMHLCVGGECHKSHYQR